MTETTETTPTAPTKNKADVDVSIEENEIRVTAQGKMRNYVAYAATLFSESKSHTVVLKGMGRVINKTVSLAEILKRRVKGLYQLAEIGSIKVVDKKHPKGDEEPTEVVRLLSVIKIVLTTEPEDRTKFQPPLDESMVEPLVTNLPKRVRPNRNRKKVKKEVKEAAPVTDAKKEEAKPAKAKRPKRRKNKRTKKDDGKESEAAAAEMKNTTDATTTKETKKETAAADAAPKETTGTNA